MIRIDVYKVTGEHICGTNFAKRLPAYVKRSAYTKLMLQAKVNKASYAIVQCDGQRRHFMWHTVMEAIDKRAWADNLLDGFTDTEQMKRFYKAVTGWEV